MKVILGLALVLLLLLLLLPMGMSEMADCPMCTSRDTHLMLGICAAVISLIGLLVLLTSSRLRLQEEFARAFLASRSIYRPPRVT